MFFLAALVLFLDQLTKLLVERALPLDTSRVMVEGFFSLVHWGNTGAAWSLFHGKNLILAGIGAVSLVAIYHFRHHFEFARPGGQIALGMMCGGILGNLADRIFRGHVVDFLYFFIQTRQGREIGYPAFNIADIGICTGAAIIVLMGIMRAREEHA
ncbi:MAG: signal peptidase II [Verrucomicrobiota bacterium]|jgi:signal peptidase II|nr:signal peptidase II [Verrucomicrobiota bacterium]